MDIVYCNYEELGRCADLLNTAIEDLPAGTSPQITGKLEAVLMVLCDLLNTAEEEDPYHHYHHTK